MFPYLLAIYDTRRWATITDLLTNLFSVSFWTLVLNNLNLAFRMFLGSVSNYCAHHASCPVIIIKENDSVNKIN